MFAWIWGGLMHRKYILIVFFASILPGLALAQTQSPSVGTQTQSSDKKTQGTKIKQSTKTRQNNPSPTPPNQAQQSQAQAGQNQQSQVQELPPCPPPPGKILADRTKAALACEWLEPRVVSHMLHALELSIGNSKDTVNELLGELAKGAPSKKVLYRTALGNPDAHGQPTIQGLPDMLENLATANTRNTQKMEEPETSYLFLDAARLISSVFDDDDGILAVATIDGLFNQGNKHRALYELLSAIPEGDPHYVHDLETLRAAYEKDSDRLKKLFDDKILVPKK